MLRIDGRGYGPAVLGKLLETAGETTSYVRGARLARRTCEVSISPKHLSALVHEVGTELARARDARAAAHRRGGLRPDADQPPVDVACVQVDGGRLRTRTPGHGRGVHGHGWRQPNYAVLWRMTGGTFDEDPHPDPPRCLLDPPAVRKLVVGLKGRAGTRPDDEQPAPAPHDGEEPSERWQPERVFRTCVATMRDVHGFGPLVAAEAQRRGFYDAARQVFLGDGQASNWTVHRLHFPHFTPITDFTHVVEYLYEAAAAVTADTPAAHWEQYAQWLTACWRGRVLEVVAELDRWQATLGEPPDDDAEHDPREVVRRTRGYLRNNADRMHYPRYRRAGLPVTSALIESLIKEFNKRVKGSEKLWNDPDRAESILQLEAALLSHGDPLAKHLAQRPGHPFVRKSSRREKTSKR